MATYNTFVVMDCKKRTPLLVTSSARKANSTLTTGYRIEVWSENRRMESIYSKNRKGIKPYIELERNYIKQKQERKTYGKSYRKVRQG
jgi:hypothetical protein